MSYSSLFEFIPLFFDFKSVIDFHRPTSIEPSPSRCRVTQKFQVASSMYSTFPSFVFQLSASVSVGLSISRTRRRSARLQALGLTAVHGLLNRPFFYKLCLALLLRSAPDAATLSNRAATPHSLSNASQLWDHPCLFLLWSWSRNAETELR